MAHGLRELTWKNMFSLHKISNSAKEIVAILTLGASYSFTGKLKIINDLHFHYVKSLKHIWIGSQASQSLDWALFYN